MLVVRRVDAAPSPGRCCRGRRRHAVRRAVASSAPARTTSCTAGDLFPEGRLDQDLQQVDLRDRNSWRLTLAEVSSVELLETSWSTPWRRSC
jgi:hypothetical protein